VVLTLRFLFHRRRANRVVLFLFHWRPVHFSSTDDGWPRGSEFRGSSSTQFDSSPLPFPFLFPSSSTDDARTVRRTANEFGCGGRSQRGGRTTAAWPPNDASSQRVPARRPGDASPSAAVGVGRRQRGGAASSRYAFLTLISYVPRPFLEKFHDVPVPRFGTKFPKRSTRHRSAFPVTKVLPIHQIGSA
jgi:hypothetical protein